LPGVSRQSYQSQKSVDAIVDLVRVGVAGNAGGVRQIATRLMREVPSEVTDAEGFRSRLAEAVVSAQARPPLRSASAVSLDTLNPLVRASRPDLSALPPLILEEQVAAAVDRLICQWKDPARLLAAGVEPAYTVLLRGAPGVGKTLIATHVAASLALPLLTANLAEVVSSLLGGTGRNLRDALTTAANGQGVMLLDEFDAVAKRRDDMSDIGELKRIVNVLILELDCWPHDRLLIAATNHPHLLDSAVTRRFELVLDIPMPGGDERRRALAAFLGSAAESQDLIDFATTATSGFSVADVERMARSATRRVALGASTIEVAVVSEIADHHRDRGVTRDQLLLSASQLAGLSNRQLGRLFGLSHPAVAAAIRRAKEQSS
jgi:MoxR-like ATPase